MHTIPSFLLACAILLINIQCVLPMVTMKRTGTQMVRTSIQSTKPDSGHHVCKHLKGLVKKQKKICRRYPNLMASVVHGYMIGIRECQWQFKHRQWNCSAQTGDRTKTIFSNLLDEGTREAAYVLAVTSAGVSHSVTRACSTGLHQSCGCDRTIYDQKHGKKHRWSGCSDNIHFGDAFSRRFIDSYERRTMRRNPGLAMMKLHNNAAGRMSLVDEMRIKCKCHGVSGSCELRTCWRALPNFREIGDILRSRFDSATEVRFQGHGLYMSDGSHLKTIEPKQLIYLQKSRNFCSLNGQKSSTAGRACNRTSTGPDSCHKLCCFQRYTTRLEVQERQCDCKFKWCCSVRCKTCITNVHVSVCQ